jgi:Dullard-like phosphatase family protein
MEVRTIYGKGNSLGKKVVTAGASLTQKTMKRFQNLISAPRNLNNCKPCYPSQLMPAPVKPKPSEISLCVTNNKENKLPSSSHTKSITPTGKASGGFQKFSHFLSPLLVAKTINSSIQKKLKTAGVKNSFENRFKILEAKTTLENHTVSKPNINSQFHGTSFRQDKIKPKLASARLSPDPKPNTHSFQMSVNFKSNSREKSGPNHIKPLLKPLFDSKTLLHEFSPKIVRNEKKLTMRSNSREEFNLYNKKAQNQSKQLQSPSLKNITFSNFLNQTKASTVIPAFESIVVEDLSLTDIFKQYSLLMQLYDSFFMNEISPELLNTIQSNCFLPDGLISPEKHLNSKSNCYTSLKISLRLQQVVLSLIWAAKDLIFEVIEPAKELLSKICYSLYCMLILLKRFYKSQGELEAARYIGSFLRLKGFKLNFSPPLSISEAITETNGHLTTSLPTFLEFFSPSIRKQQLRTLIKTAIDLKKPESEFASKITEVLCENKPVLLSSQSALSQGEHILSPESKGHTETSLFCDEDDPYFILQPLRSDHYLPPKKQTDKKHTLVLDLDETLVHFEENNDGGQFLIRPYAQEFLVKMKEHYEVVIFTAAVKDYADWILDRIDLEKSVSHRLYRQHTTFQNGVYMKDLSKLGRDLSKSIIIDNNAENFQLQPDNGIYIKTWHDDPHDIALKQLTRLMVRVIEEGEEDIRVGLRNIQQKLAQKYKGTGN